MTGVKRKQVKPKKKNHLGREKCDILYGAGPQIHMETGLLTVVDH